MKKFKLLSLILLISLTFVSCDELEKFDTNDQVTSESNDQIEKIDYETGTITKVTDEDTFRVNINGAEEKVRLILVDTPETVHPQKPVQYYGKEASDYAKETLTIGKKVYLTKDVSNRDRYDRILRYVWLEPPTSESKEEISNKCFNAILLKEGYSQLSTYPPDIKYLDIFKELQTEARKNEKGMWQNPEQIGKGVE